VTVFAPSVPKATRVRPAQDFDPARVIDSVILDQAQRRAPRGERVCVNGLRFALELATPTHLRMGDALQLEDGRLIEVVAEAEPLIEVRAVDATALARIAFHLGDRHVPVQLLANRIRLRRDHALESLIASLGGKCAKIEAPFDPEGGAYVEPAQAHSHDRHSHERGSHTHGPGGHEHHNSEA